MADAYTTGLNLTLMEVGQHDASWGAIANTNFSAIDTKFVGITTINSTGETLTLTETQQKVNLIKLTGTLVAPMVVNFNATGGTWIISNAMVQGAFSVTFKVTGQTGFTLAPLTDSLVYYNGTDVAPLASIVTATANFRAAKTPAQSVLNTSATKVTFETEQYDVGGYYASSRWTPPAGKVLVGAQLYLTAVSSGGTATLQIRRNSTTVAQDYKVVGTAADAQLEATVFIDTNGTDYFEVYVQSSDSSYSVSTSQSFFWGSIV